MDDSKTYSADEETNTHSENNAGLGLDPDDINIINDPSTWDPPLECLLSYAKSLEFDVENDPPELLDIAKKYLLRTLPEGYLLAYVKDTYQIFYINSNTYVIYVELGFEEEAKEEYINKKIQLLEEKEKEKENKNEEKEDKKEEEKEDKIEEEKEDKKDEEEEKEKEEKEEEDEENKGEKEEKKEGKKEEQEEEKKKEKKENEENEESDEEIKYIDPEDIIIIYDQLTWEPAEKYIMSYACKLGYDKDKDPPEILDIAKKYLITPLPNIYIAFIKNNNQILYINKDNNEIELNNEKEEDAKKEFEMLRKKKDEEKEKNSEDNKDNEFTEEKSDDTESIDIIIDRKFLLDKAKIKYYNFKNKLKEKYINNKKNLKKAYKEKYNKMKKEEEIKLKDKYDKENINLINTLEEEFKKNINTFKEQLKKEFLNNYKESKYQSNNEKESLRVKMENLENDIKNKKNLIRTKIYSQKTKIKNEIELKKSTLDKKKYNKTLTIKSQLDKAYEEYTKNFKKNFINENTKDINDKIKLIRQKNDILLEEYELELKENNEALKSIIKNELEVKIQKDINEYKKHIINKNKTEADEINNKIINIEKNCDNVIDLLKKESDDNKKTLEKEIDKLNDNIKMIYNEKIFEIIKKEGDEIIKNNNNKVNFEDYLMEKKIEKNLKLNKIKMLYDLSEKEYKNKMINIELYKNLILLITKKILENNNLYDKMNNSNEKENYKFNDALLINELLIDVQQLIKNFSFEYNSLNNKGLFLILEDNLNKLNTINENLFKKINIFNISNTFKRDIIYKDAEKYINKNLNQQLKNNSNNNSKYSSINNVFNNSNKIVINNSKTISKVKDYRLNYYLPKLNKNIKNQFSFENFYLYNKIMDKFLEEYKSLEMKINTLNNKISLNNKLNNNRYNNIKYNEFFKNNIQNLHIYEKDVNNNKKKLNKIKNECDILFSDINYGLYNSECINEKLRTILEKFEDDTKNDNIYYLNNINNINNINNDNINKNTKKSSSLDLKNKSTQLAKNYYTLNKTDKKENKREKKYINNIYIHYPLNIHNLFHNF